MKKIILSVILVSFLKAFVDMPYGWRCRKKLYNYDVYGYDFTVAWVNAKGDTICGVFVADSGYTLPMTLFFTKSSDCGFTWSFPSLVDPGIYLVSCPRVVIENQGGNIFIYVGFRQNYGVYDIVHIYRSSDLGNTWTRIAGFGGQFTPAFAPWLDCRSNKIALVYRRDDSGVMNGYFTYSENHGNNWITPEILNVQWDLRVVIDANGDFYIFGKEGTGLAKLGKRTGANQWQYWNFPETDVVFAEPNRLIRADPETPGVLHFVYSTGGNIYYRKFSNGSWSNRIFIAQGTNADFVVESGGKIHVLVGFYQGSYNYEVKHYVSTDGGNTWSLKGTLYNMRTFCYEKNKRGRSLALVDVGNNVRGKIIYQGNDDYSLSNKYLATAYNHSRHLARQPNTDDLYAVFSMENDSGDVVVVKSPDGGRTWEDYKVIGHGLVGTPCIWIDATQPDILTCLWINSQNENFLQYRRFNISANSWSNVYTLPIPGEYKIDLSSPSISMCETKRKLVAPVDVIAVALRVNQVGGGKCLLGIVYNINDPLNPQILHYGKIEQGEATNPSISYSYVNGLKFHCVYEKDQKIYYSERHHGEENWTPPYQISNIGKDAYNPSIEVYGDSLYAVWSEDEGTGKHDIWRRRKKVTEPWDYWPRDPELISENSPNYDSRYPTNSELRFCLWLEEDHSNTDYDPWYRYNGDPPAVFYNTSEESYFPHANRYNAGSAIWLYGIWTEKDNLLYRITSYKRLYAPTSQFESAYLSYSAEDENSPYLIQREGIKTYGNIKVDIGENLIYEFELDTIYNYEVETEFYFEGTGQRKGMVLTSNMTPITFTYTSGEIKRVKFPVEKRFLVDEKKLYLTFKKISGPEISLKSIKIYRYEREEETGGGPQSKGISQSQPPILKIYPVIAKDRFTLTYTVKSLSPLEITLYDILGRKVYTLLKEKLIAPGTYKTEFKKPENLKSGIYFIKLNSDNTKEVKKIIFSR